MESEVHIESRPYRLDAKQDLHDSIKGSLRAGWPRFLLLAALSGACVIVGYVLAEPAFATLGLMPLAVVGVAFLQLRRYYRPSADRFHRDQQLTVHGAEVKLSDSVGNARIKPLHLLSKVESKGRYLNFHFSDGRAIAAPLDAFSSDHVAELQQLVKSPHAEPPVHS